MIAINLTLLFQIVHFFIAYLLLRFFILKPILSLVQKEKQARQSLLSNLQNLKEQVTIKEQEKQNAWLHYQYYFALHTPNVEKAAHIFFKKNVPPLTLVPPEPNQVDRGIKQMVEYIIKEGAK